MNHEPEVVSHSFQPREVHLVLPGRKPIVTYTIFGFTVFIFILQFVSELTLGFDMPAALGMKVGDLIRQGQVWRLITPVFLHGSILHVGVNMYSLMILGPVLENACGRWRYLTLYMLCGFAGNVASFFFSPAPSLGSSTAIFGLIAAQGVFIYQNRKVFGSRARRMLTNIVMVTLLNFIIGMSPGIDNWGHLGGFLAGLAFSWIGGPLLESVQQQIDGGRMFIILADRRAAQAVWIAAALVGLVFAFLAAYKIYLLPA